MIVITNEGVFNVQDFYKLEIIHRKDSSLWLESRDADNDLQDAWILCRINELGGSTEQVRLSIFLNVCKDMNKMLVDGCLNKQAVDLRVA